MCTNIGNQTLKFFDPLNINRRFIVFAIYSNQYFVLTNFLSNQNINLA